MSLLGEHVLLAAAWLAYGAIHSWLASPSTKAWVRSRRPEPAARYRVIYNVPALALLLPPLVLTFAIERAPGRARAAELGLPAGWRSLGYSVSTGRYDITTYVSFLACGRKPAASCVSRPCIDT